MKQLKNFQNQPLCSSHNMYIVIVNGLNVVYYNTINIIIIINSSSNSITYMDDDFHSQKSFETFTYKKILASDSRLRFFQESQVFRNLP
jgi:hypothetical protein